MEYDFELERIMSQIKASEAKLVGLQFPEGLKYKAVEMASEIESKTDSKVIVLSDPTYGACDMKSWQTKMLGLDLLVHFGHTEFEG